MSVKRRESNLLSSLFDFHFTHSKLGVFSRINQVRGPKKWFILGVTLIGRKQRPVFFLKQK